MSRDLDLAYRTHSRKVFASLVRLLGDFDLAEEALHDAFVAASEQWPRDGVPANPAAWLTSVGRFRTIDRLRRKARFDSAKADMADALYAIQPAEADPGGPIEDDRLALVFTCCHPAISADAQVALTLREVCGLTTEEIAAAYLSPAPRIAQRIVRAKQKIREARIPFEAPGRSELQERLAVVLRVIYLVFNQGYSAPVAARAGEPHLSAEAIRLGRLLIELLPGPEPEGLLALMLFHESRRSARISADGALILLADQDRRLWDKAAIEEAASLLQRSLASRRFGPYTVQAAIAGVHTQAASSDETDWAEIVSLYDLLLRLEPSPVTELNRAVALAMRDGPAAGLRLVDQILGRGDLPEYHLAHAARADLCRRLGRIAEARDAYREALRHARGDSERTFLHRRLAELE